MPLSLPIQVMTQGYTLEVTRRIRPIGGLIQALIQDSSDIYEN